MHNYFNIDEYSTFEKQELSERASSTSKEDQLCNELDDSLEHLCGTCQWDVNNSGEQLEAFHMANVSTCQLGFEKVSYMN